MSPLSPSEARLLERLERGFGLRLLAGPVIGALGGVVFASLMMGAAGASGRFTLGDTSPAYAALERAIGAAPAFVVLCAAVFGGLGVLLAVVVALGLASMRGRLRERREVFGVAPPRGRVEA
jgi:hypothetical protein